MALLRVQTLTKCPSRVSSLWFFMQLLTYYHLVIRTGYAAKVSQHSVAPPSKPLAVARPGGTKTSNSIEDILPTTS